MPTEVVQNEKFNVCSSGITVQENGKVAVHDSSIGRKYVLGENVYQRGIVRFKLKLESFHNNHWIMVGILKAEIVPDDKNSFSWTGSNGWSLGNYGQVYNKGSHTYNDSLKKLSKQGDTWLS